MIRSSMLIATCLALLSYACADDNDDAIKKEVAKFQGEWVMVGDDQALLKIKGDDYEFSKTNYLEKGKQTLNPKAKPAEVDVDIKEGDGAGKQQLGIYEIDGDRLNFSLLPPAARNVPPSLNSRWKIEPWFIDS